MLYVAPDVARAANTTRSLAAPENVNASKSAGPDVEPERHSSDVMPPPSASPAATSGPVVTLSTGFGGTINSWEALRDRNAIYNVVTVTGERLNGQAPVYGTASDANPASPTYVGGGFGVRSLLDRLQTPSSQGGAIGAARERLAASIAPVEAFQLRCSADASLELGDAVVLSIDGRETLQVVSALSVPLSVDGDMFVSTRSMVVNELEGS